MAKKKASATATRECRCVVTGEVLQWVGYGRPPKYSEAARKQIASEKRKAKYAAKKAAA